MKHAKKREETKSIEDMQRNQQDFYEEYLTRCWHKVKNTLHEIRQVNGALCGLQILFENISDVPSQNIHFAGVGCLVGLVRDRMEDVEKELDSTQGLWMDEWRLKFQDIKNN